MFKRIKRKALLSTLLTLTIFLLLACNKQTSSSSTSSSSTTSSSTSTTSPSSSTSSSSSSSSTSSPSSSSSSYYGAATGQSGLTLKNTLRTIMTNNHYQTTYSEIRYMFVGSDADPNQAGNLILFYSRESVLGIWDEGITFNREHVWPQSLGGFGRELAGSDLHHIRPTAPNVNSSRGNKPFAELGNSYTATTKYGEKIVGYSDNNYWEPLDEVKGDIARIIMYLIVRYSELETRFSETEHSPIKDGSYTLLLQWHNDDPVDDLERNRNEYVYSVQNNRNAFIDHPEFADLIWS